MLIKNTEISSSEITPFLKWLGGKRWLTNEIKNRIIGQNIKRYVEPFLGGGAVFFSLRIKPAILSDINSDLINTYIQVRDNHDEILNKINKINTDSKTYYKIRSAKPQKITNKAARFIYLNRTAFGGIYRVNNKGEFNVPYGNYKNNIEVLWRNNLLINASKALQGTMIICSDFENIINQTKTGDLVYCDPTYTTMHNNNGFKKYNEKCFSWKDQERLAVACNKAALRGAKIIVSNAYHDELLRLYNGFETTILERNSILCPDSSKRKIVQEYLFFSNNFNSHEKEELRLRS